LRQIGFAARNRHFGADHVHRRRQAGLRRPLGDDAQARRARGNHFVAQVLRIVGAAHAAIEVDLVEAGRGVGGDQDFGVLHGGAVQPSARRSGRGGRRPAPAAPAGSLAARQIVHVGDNCGGVMPV
jgi:hypothetical protein